MLGRGSQVSEVQKFSVRESSHDLPSLSCGECGRYFIAVSVVDAAWRVSPRPAPDDYPPASYSMSGSMAPRPSIPYRKVDPCLQSPIARPAPEVHRIEYQRPLFRGRTSSDGAFRYQCPVRKRRNGSSTHRSRTGQHTARKATTQNAAQQSLVFEDLSAQESVPLIYCDAPVANPLHRAVAGFLDGQHGAGIARTLPADFRIVLAEKSC